MPGTKNSFVLFTKGRHHCKNLVALLVLAWKESCLQGKPDFTLIRTAVSKYVSAHTWLIIQICLTTDTKGDTN